MTLLAKIKNETSGGFLSSLSSGVIPLPHQLHVLNRALETNNVRYILADEVGLGKTIEAGMIIKELKSRGLVSRTLVVCPTGLVTQWSSEMQEKFHEKFQVILPSDYDTIRRLTDSDDVYRQYDQVISPMDSIKPLERHAGWTDEKVEKYNQDRIYSIINSGWDLIIIDEAHRVAGSTGDVARYKLGNLLSQASPYLLLLSATPHNGKTEPFLRLVRLLDKDAFPNAKSIVKEQVAPYLIRTEKREAIDNNGNLLFKNRVTHLVSLTWDDRNSLQRELYQKVSSYVSKTYAKAQRNRKKNMCLIFLLIIMQRMSEFQDEITTAQLKQKIYDEWGERPTLYHSIDKLVATMKAFDVLTCDKPGKYHIKMHCVPKDEIASFMVYTAMNIDGSAYYSLQGINSFAYLFPFEYQMRKEMLLRDERFEMHNFGGELSIGLKER
ncbi:MAG: DEAD/DEAH box helicase [Lachnospiraceae bacterium]|nr:DEAD/DEAH box helicase [Lachnospiraceae bacterium]